MQNGAVYRAREDEGAELHDLPAQECVDCGSICPDAERIDQVDPSKVPSSVRLRCARMRASGF
jgi:hypothetical protein